MPDYRLYFMDEQRHVRRRLDIECRDDAHAIQVVSETLAQEAMELWQGGRVVRVFSGDRRRTPNA